MAESTTADGSQAPAAEPKKSKMMVIIIAVVVAMGAAAGGAYWLGSKQDADHESETAEDGKSVAKKDAKSAKPKGPAIYVEFDPPFVANFEARGQTRFLQVTVQALTRDPATAEMIKQHDPVIRNDLLLMFSNQSYETISTREGKDALRAQALEAVAKVINDEGGNGKNVEQLYFTSFVMQ